jgi:hypothetical protein
VRRSHIALVAFSALLFAGAGTARAQSTYTVTTDSSATATTAKDTTAAVTKSKPSKPAKADQSRLTSDEIVTANLPTAYDLVERLRRPWLRRDALTGGDVQVYMDGHIVGGAEVLRDTPSADVADMQYLANSEAVRKWGGDIKGSVIQITRRR